MPNQQMMTQGQAQGQGTPSVMPCYGPGMMGGGYGRGSVGLNLTPDQVSKIEKIRDDLSKANEPLAQQMFQARNKMQEAYFGGNADPVEIKKSYAKMSELQKRMFDMSINAQKRMDDVLTKEQRAWRGSMMGY